MSIMAAPSAQRVAVLAVAGLLYISALLHGVEAQCGQFSSSCRDFSIEMIGGALTANCRNNAGNFVGTKIELNRYLGNYNGVLRPGSGFVNSCSISSPFLTTPLSHAVTIKADCRTGQGYNFDKTSYDVNRNIANYNGKLKWNNCRRRALLESDDKVLNASSTPE